MLNLNQLRAFVTIVDRGGFRNAAEELDVSQPTISQQTRKLEEHLRVKLLVRGRGGCALTRHGEYLLPHARGLIRAAERAEVAVSSVNLILGASSNIGIYIVQRFLRRFSEENKHALKTEVVIGTNPDVQARLLAGEIDLALVEWWAPTPGFRSVPWREERLVIILPPGHKLGRYSALPPRILFALPLLGGESGTGTGTLLKEALGADAKKVRVNRNLGSTEAVKQAVRAGLGASLVLESTVRDEAKNGALLVRPLRGKGFVKQLLTVVPEDTPPTSMAHAFMRMLQSERGSVPG